MTRKEFDAIVNDSIAAGNDRESAEAYVIAGYKLEGKPAAEKAPAVRSASGKKAAAGSRSKK